MEDTVQGRSQGHTYTKEIILILFIILIIYCAVIGHGGSSDLYMPHMPHIPHIDDVNGHVYVRPRNNKGVTFIDNVKQRRYSKRTGRVLGDTTININDLTKS